MLGVQARVPVDAGEVERKGAPGLVLGVSALLVRAWRGPRLEPRRPTVDTMKSSFPAMTSISK